MSYPDAHKGLYAKLLGACDPRLQAFEKTGWDDDLQKIDVNDIKDEKNKETAIWLRQHGFETVELMLLHMIWALQFDLGIEDCEDMFTIDHRCFDVKMEKLDDYWVPVITILASYCKPHYYVFCAYAGNHQNIAHDDDDPFNYSIHAYGKSDSECWSVKLCSDVCHKCYNALNTTLREEAETYDYDNLDENERESIYAYNRFDVFITVKAGSDIVYRSVHLN